MNKPEPKYRKQLNDEQIKVLALLYKFRFGSSELIARYLGRKRSTDIYRRLRILEDQGLIGKRYESSYKLQGKPAAYYLLPAGARKLQECRDTELSIKAIYKDKTVSEQFVQHCLDILDINNQLKAQYGNSLRFFTKSQLNYEKYEHFPRPLPDAYIRLKTKDGENQFFLDIYHDSQPFFTAIRRTKQYINYSEEGDWSVTNTDFPTILAVCESSSLKKRLRKRIVKLVDDSWEEDMKFALTTKIELTNGQNIIWQPAEAEPDEPKKSLAEL
jgi:hypothetical protein